LIQKLLLLCPPPQGLRNDFVLELELYFELEGVCKAAAIKVQKNATEENIWQEEI